MAARTARQLRIAASRQAAKDDPWQQLLNDALQDRRRRARLRGSAYADDDHHVQSAVVAGRLARRAAASAAILELYGSSGATEAGADEVSTTEGSA